MNIVAFRSNKGGEVTHSRESGNLAVPSKHSLSSLSASKQRFQVSLDTTLKDEDCVCINCGCTAPLC